MIRFIPESRAAVHFHHHANKKESLTAKDLFYSDRRAFIDFASQVSVEVQELLKLALR
jgi:hypothetical protein